LVLAVLEGLGNFIEHGVSFLFLPTDFQALSFASPRMACHAWRAIFTAILQTANGKNARISRLTQAFRL